MALDFPASPALDDTYTEAGKTWRWNGSGWQLVAGEGGGGASVTTSDTAPTSPADGDLWYDSVGGRLYVYYDDGNTNQWVDAAPQGGGDASAAKLEVGNTKAEVTDTGSNGTFTVTTEGTGSLSVDASGRTLLGGVTANANGGVLQLSSGITFPATQVAATDPNTLDDYEEGTWTPSQGGGLTVSGSYTSQGFYTKTGNTVTVFGSLFGSTSIASSAAGIICGGLPFTPAPPTSGYVVGSMTNQAANISNTCLSLNSTNVYGSVAIPATAGIHFTMTYRV
jgi:hypothetical protein